MTLQEETVVKRKNNTRTNTKMVGLKGWIAKKNGQYFVECFPNETLEVNAFPLCSQDVELVEKTYPILPKWSGKFKVIDGIAHLYEVQRYPIPEYDPYTGEKNPYFKGGI